MRERQRPFHERTIDRNVILRPGPLQHRLDLLAEIGLVGTVDLQFSYLQLSQFNAPAVCAAT